jgi:hypothetical protein
MHIWLHIMVRVRGRDERGGVSRLHFDRCLQEIHAEQVLAENTHEKHNRAMSFSLMAKEINSSPGRHL